MTELITTRLTNRYDHLRALADVDFCRQLDSYLRIADSDRSVRRILKALRGEAAAAAEEFTATDRELTQELRTIRDRLIAAAPEIAPALDPPEPPDPLEHRHWIMQTTGGFDHEIQRPEQEFKFAPLPYYTADNNPGRTQALIHILRGRLHVAEWGIAYGRRQPPDAKVRDDLAEFGDEIENVQARYTAARTKFKHQERTLAGLAAARLQFVAERLTPEPFLRVPGEGDELFMERALQNVLVQIGDIGVLQRAAAGAIFRGAEKDMLDRLAEFLRGELDRLHAELVDRLQRERGSIRSRLREKSGWVLAAAVTALIGVAVAAVVGDAEGWFGHNAGGRNHGSSPGHSATKSDTSPSSNP